MNSPLRFTIHLSLSDILFWRALRGYAVSRTCRPPDTLLCVHLVSLAHLLFRAGSSLFMGWLPSRPPAYYCDLNIDTLSRGTAPRPPKALRCSANITRAIRARTRGALFAGNEYALFLANCPLVFIEGLVLFPSRELFAQLILCVAFGLLPRCERLCPSRSPQACWREA